MTTFCRLRQRACSARRRVREDRGLDGLELLRVVERPALAPRRGGREVAGRPPLHVHHPPRVLRARPGEQVPARELDGLGADGAEDPVRKPDRVRPRAPLVGRGAREAPPLARAGADLVEEQQGAARRLEEHRVPAGVAGAAGLPSGRDLDRCGPAAVAPPRHPDADVGVPFLRPREPRGEEAVPRLHDRGGVGRAEGGALADELRRDDRGRRLPRGREFGGEEEDDHSWLRAGPSSSIGPRDTQPSRSRTTRYRR